MQRALLQSYEPKHTPRVRKALQLAHREDLLPLLCGGRGAGKSAVSYTHLTGKTLQGKIRPQAVADDRHVQRYSHH